MSRIVIIALWAGCAVSPAERTATHPAHAAAPVGRIAPAPPSLRAGVVEYPDVPKTQAAPPTHHHHHK